jgi:hypothetical protein
VIVEALRYGRQAPRLKREQTDLAMQVEIIQPHAGDCAMSARHGRRRHDADAQPGLDHREQRGDVADFEPRLR